MSVVVRQLINSPQDLKIPPQTGPTGVFLLPALLAMWQKTLGWTGISVNAGNLALVGFEKPTAVGKLFFSMPFGGYGGVLGEGSRVEFDAILAWLRGRKYLQENIVQFAAAAPITYAGAYYQNKLATHIIDLSKSTDGYSENTKRNIKKAQERDFKTVRIGAPDSAKYLQLLQAHQKRTGEIRRMPQDCYEYFLTMSDRSDSGVTVFAAINDNSLQCVHIYFVTATDAFYFDGFSSQDGLDAGANFLLLDNMIQRFCDSGIQRLNLGATPPLDKGLRRFKEGWGATEIEYVEYSRRSQLKRFIDFMTRVR